MNLFRRLFKVDIDDFEARYRSGRAHMKKKHWNEAVQELQIATSIDPNNATAQFALGISHGVLGHLDDSIRAFRAALDLRPDMAEAHYNLSMVYEEIGQLDKAICEAQEALLLGFEPARELIEKLERHPLWLMHVRELRKVAGKLGIKDLSRTKKSELLEAIRLWKIEHSDSAPNSKLEPFPFHDSNGLLLRAICRELKARDYSVGNYTRLKKSDLIALLGKMVVEHNLDLMKFVADFMICEEIRTKAAEFTVADLRRLAAKLNIKGRSQMNKAALVQAVLLRTFGTSRLDSLQSEVQQRKDQSRQGYGQPRKDYQRGGQGWYEHGRRERRIQIQDYYKILQVDPSAEPEVITGAYRRLAAKYHPDVYKEQNATRKMQLINEAYEVLSDPAKRGEYDTLRTFQMWRQWPV